MKNILNSTQMKTIDEDTQNTYFVPSLVLMERAALSVCDYILSKFNKDKTIGVVCGSGNNGGDGMALVRLLNQSGYRVKWLLVGDSEKFTESTKRQYEILEAYGFLQSHSIIDLSDCDVLVDAIFGIGLSRDLGKNLIKIIDRINSYDAFKIAIDIPSGLNATSGNVMGACVVCDVTITFAYEKLGLFLFRGGDFCGKIICADIGIKRDNLNEDKSYVKAIEKEDLKELLPKRTADSHKGTYGRVLVIAGKKDMAGACYLCSKAAMMAGCGLVKIYTEEENRIILQTLLPEAMLSTYKNKYSKTTLKKELSWATTVLIGPGLGTDENKADLLKYVIKNTNLPMVCDADALTIISRDLDILKKKKSPIIITPHIGEMGQLLNEQVFFVLSNMLNTAVNFSVKHDIITVLKSASTITATSDGRAYLNIYGNNGMSTGGSGDVLSGLIAGFLATKCEPDIAALIGVCIHSLSGDVASHEKSAYSMKAEDIIDAIPKVIKEITEG